MSENVDEIASGNHSQQKMAENQADVSRETSDKFDGRKCNLTLEEGLEPVEQETGKKTARFLVENVDSPTETEHRLQKNDSFEYTYQDTGAETIGFPTHEVVPMTVFYRNQSSIGDGVAQRQRPTIKTLRQGLDELDEENNEDVPLDASTQGLDSEVKLSLPLPKLKFGWCKGVLVPCLLNIWGVILYLRLPWLTGQAGMGLMTLIVILAAIVTTITTMSMSAICTNGEVKGGGAYYLISRSLGPEFGGSIGIIFSLANAVGVALYVVGFAETIQKLMEQHGVIMVNPVNDIRIIGIIVVILLVGITLIGLEWVVRAQLLLLVILLISMADYFFGTIFGPLDIKSDVIKSQGFTGYSQKTFTENLGPTFQGQSFFTVFSIFFPAATGILAGANISGDLKDPQVAVPRGTLLAILITTLTYIGFVWMIGSSSAKDVSVAVGCVAAGMSNGTLGNLKPTLSTNTTTSCVPSIMKYGLLNDYRLMEKVSLYGPLVLAGIFAATLSSALASLVGSPKTFQAVCKDKIFHGLEFFGKGSGPNDEPRRAYVLAFFISTGFILIGQLNIIAPIISNFFLMSYALINYSVFAASLGKSPGWRPSFKYHNMWLSLFGCGICIAIMFLVNWWAALVTIVIVMSLYKYVAYRKPEINWGSSGQAQTYRKALQLAHTLNEIEDHVKNFRPQCLVLTGLPSSRTDLVHFVSYLTKNMGLMVCGDVKISKDGVNDQTVNQDKWLRRNKVKAFHVTCSAPTFRIGVQSMIQNVGLGKLKPNILVLGFKDNWRTADLQQIDDYTDVINDAFDYNYSVAILRLPKGTHLEEDSDLEADYSDEDGSDLEVRMPKASVIPEASSVELDVEATLESNKELESDTPGSTPVMPRETTPMMPQESEKGLLTDEEKKPTKKNEADVKKVPKDVIIGSLTEKQKGYLDVWWLFDDGGLTILLPHLLTRSRIWRECSLRVFVARANRKLKSNEVRMASLLKKFRIDVSAVVEVSGVNSRPSAESIESFKELRAGTDVSSEEDLDKKTLRQIRLGELVKEHSSEAKLVVLTLPVPRKTVVSPVLFMSWLETLSAQTPPVLFVRGNQASVLTFYS
eukprot:gene3357-3846_t